MPQYIGAFAAPLRDNPLAQFFTLLALALTVADILFGVIRACMAGCFSSRAMREGIGHKVASVGWWLVFAMLDAMATVVAHDAAGLTLIVGCSYLVVMELGSLMETLAKLDPSKSWIRDKATPILERLGIVEDPDVLQATNVEVSDE